MWNVYILGKIVIANPAFHNISENATINTLIAETNTITSYDNDANLFYNTIPKETVVNLIKIEIINSSALDKITFEEEKI